MIAQKTFLFVCGAFACCRLVLAEPKSSIAPAEEMSLKDAVLKADSVMSLKEAVAKADNIFIGEFSSSGGLVLSGNQVRPGDAQVKVVRVIHGSGPTQSLVTCWSDRMWLSLTMDSHHKYLIFARKPGPPFPDTYYYFFDLVAADDSTLAQVERLLGGKMGLSRAE